VEEESTLIKFSVCSSVEAEEEASLEVSHNSALEVKMKASAASQEWAEAVEEEMEDFLFLLKND
jgi:hypothetical protein